MFDDFETLIDRRFYNHIQYKSNIPFKICKSKSQFLKDLREKIEKKSYHPQTPRAYVVTGKEHLVSRIVPILQPEDSSIYYYCIRSIENDLSKTRVDGTYGGFSMGGSIRKLEDTDWSVLSEQVSTSNYPYNPTLWTKYWSDFQNKIYLYSNMKENSYFIKFDIANFYDTINLNYLETKIRSVCASSSLFKIDLLMYFLRHWNRDFENFKQKNIGIPQDEIGDCSRVLANFYLHEYDQYIKEEADKLECSYFRYSDDQIIMAKDQTSAKKLLFLASNYLTKINLNINPKKIDIFETKDDFRNYWAFDIFENLSEPFELNRIESAIKTFLEFKNKKMNFRKSSVLKKIVNTLVRSEITIDLTLKKEIESEIVADAYILACSVFDIDNIYKILDSTSKKQFISKLIILSKRYLFNQFHYSLLNSKNIPIDKAEVKNAMITFI